MLYKPLFFLLITYCSKVVHSLKLEAATFTPDGKGFSSDA